MGSPFAVDNPAAVGRFRQRMRFGEVRSQGKGSAARSIDLFNPPREAYLWLSPEIRSP